MYRLGLWDKCEDYTEPVETSDPELCRLVVENGAELVFAYWYGMLDPNMAGLALLKGDQLAYIQCV